MRVRGSRTRPLAAASAASAAERDAVAVNETLTLTRALAAEVVVVGEPVAARVIEAE